MVCRTFEIALKKSKACLSKLMIVTFVLDQKQIPQVHGEYMYINCLY